MIDVNNIETTPESSNIDLKSISDLLGMDFFIPGYQRGYRWTERQVEDLLEDIWEFMGGPREQEKSHWLTWWKKDSSEFYCLQPLVVKKMKQNDERLKGVAGTDQEEWDEVVDGQQRLTTIKIILSCFEAQSYPIKYETRTADPATKKIGSELFLDKINEPYVDNRHIKDVAESNIDFWHMYQAWKTISTWLDPLSKEDKEKFKTTLLHQVKFIWYEIPESEDPIEVFTRLNIGKISLTNAELIKALFLNRSNWGRQTNDVLALSQLEIASQWDNIEYTLQNDEFWMFFHDESAPATRIDYIFDYICDQDLLKAGNDQKNIGNDRYRTFRYFYNFFKAPGSNGCDKIKECWCKVKEIFGTLQEWYNDCELYHYAGFLVAEGNHGEMDALLSAWIDKEEKDKNDQYKRGTFGRFLEDQSSPKARDKKSFCDWLKVKIKEKISGYLNLRMQYEVNGGDEKTKCRPLLLFFNVQTVIDQNKAYTGNQQYKLGVFYKFPFHLYKREKWDIEHIDSNTGNDLDHRKDQEEWILNSLYELYNRKVDGKRENKPIRISDIIKSEETRGAICSFLNARDAKSDFEKIHEAIMELLRGTSSCKWNSEDAEKNQIWNFALLDRGTNRSYHNDLFPTKRRKLIAKDQGKYISLDWDPSESAIVIKKQQAEIAFVPPCTKNVFLKYYTPGNNDIWSWNVFDAVNYRQAIYETLKQFDVFIGN